MWKTLIRRFRSWQALTAGVLVIVVAAVYIVMVNERAKQEERTIAAIERLGGLVQRRYSNDLKIPGVPTRFGPLDFVYFLGPKVGDRELEVLEGAPELRSLVLTNTQETDKGIAWLARFPKLTFLAIGSIDMTKVHGPKAAKFNVRSRWTGEGLERLNSLPNLQVLQLSGPHVTDDDLPVLISFKRVLVISLFQTSVTKEGVAKLQKALPNCKVNYR